MRAGARGHGEGQRREGRGWSCGPGWKPTRLLGRGTKDGRRNAAEGYLDRLPDGSP